MKWSGLTVVGVILVANVGILACALNRFGVQNYEQSLRLQVSLASSQGRVGDEVGATYRLMNASDHLVEGCLAEAKGYNFWLPGGGAKGQVETIDHPGCVRRFALEPGQSIEWSDHLKVLDVGFGSARVGVWAQLSDPTRCDQYGCDAVHVEAPFVDFEIVRDNVAHESGTV